MDISVERLCLNNIMAYSDIFLLHKIFFNGLINFFMRLRKQMKSHKLYKYYSK